MAEEAGGKELNDLRQVMEEEKRRGRRPIDPAARKRRTELLRYLRNLIHEADERRFREAIRAHGLRDGTEEFEVALRIWREGQKNR